MMTRSSIYLVSAALLAGVAFAAMPSKAQQVPPGQTCGGLLCDMGVFGHKVAPNADGTPPSQQQVAAAEAADPHRLPCNDFLCRAFGGKSAQEIAQAAPPAPVPAAEPVAEPAKAKKARSKKRVAKAEPKSNETAAAAQ